ncbi:Ferric reduction oxidase 8 [Globisporangium polare]
MAAAKLPSTPTEHGGYTIVKTPRSSAIGGGLDAASLQQSVEARRSASVFARYPILVILAQFLVVAAIGVCIYGQIMVFTNYYNLDLKVVISAWWGVPKAQALAGFGAKMVQKGHSELVRPTFVFLFFVFPLVTSLLLVEFLRNFNVRRATSKHILSLARTLRRKPQVPVFGSVSPFSYGELLFLVVFLIGGNVLAFYYGFDRQLTRAKETAAKRKQKHVELNEYIDMVAVTLGFNCIYNMAFLFLPATRNSAWMEFLNISYANAVKYHRWLGVATVFTALAHCVSFYWLWVREGVWTKQVVPCFDCSLTTQPGRQIWMNVFGQLALLCFLAIGITSIPFVRRNTYNLFYYVHHLFGLAVVFAVLHWAPIVWWVYPTFMLYLSNRAISSSNAFYPVEVKEFTSISESIIKVVIARSPQRSGVYKLGQFVYLNVPAVSKLQWHAFTIASSPKTNAKTLTVLVKSLGDWTNDLVQYAEDCKQKNVVPTVYLDGYYGASLELYSEYSTICLIGGGIGVTPLIAILEDIAAKLSHHEPPTQRVYFIFTFRELALLEEILPLLTRIREFDPQESFFKLHLSLTREPQQELLDQQIGATTTRNHILSTHPTSHSQASSKPTPRPFVEPLRSQGSRSLTYLTVFFISFAVVVTLEYGSGKIKGNGRDNLWMLQQFTEILVLFASALVVFGFAFVERHHFHTKKSHSNSKSKDPREDCDVTNVPVSISRTSVSHASAHLHTYRDLLHEFRVAVGHRQDIADILKEAHGIHRESSSVEVPQTTIGVFVSGPSALVSATERAVATLGSADFDIHEEEFEL